MNIQKAVVIGLLASAMLAAGQQQRRSLGEPPPSDEATSAQASDNAKSATQNTTQNTTQKEPPAEKLSVTHHRITVRGKVLAYTASTGRMPIKNEQGHTEALMFYVAYTLDNPGPKRPLTFAFNGGPGSATVWLHMGAFGPKRVKMQPNGFMPAPPFQWEDNQDTLLDRSDLVFVDAIGTGYSRAMTPELGKKFWSLQGDLAAFGEFIRLYLQNNSRWTSPLYLAGESYGTTRAAGLSGYLVDHGIALNGVVLISTILNFGTVSFVNINDQPYILYLPTYALTAAYHHKLAPDLEAKSPDELRAEVEKWASTEYTVALEQGDGISSAQRQSVIEHLARYTGLPKQYIDRCNLRIDLSHFDTELLREEGKMIGRLDGRFAGVDKSALSQEPDFDPSEAGIRPPYTAVFGDYVKQELGYQSELTYYVLGGGIGRWDYGVNGWSGFADTSEGLRHAFAKNPFLHVFIAEGYYDAATPYFAVEYTFDHMGLTAAQRKNVSRDHFSAGHMVYIDNESLAKLTRDVDTLYDQTAPK